MHQVRNFLLRTRGRRQLHFTDIFTYGYLMLGTLLMFGPVLWLVVMRLCCWLVGSGGGRAREWARIQHL